MKKSYLFVLVSIAATAAMAFSSCNRNKADENRLQTGDLIFVGIPMDYGSSDSTSMSRAISDATGDGKLNLIHVAIAEVERDSVWIIDATIKHGVDRHPLDTFLCDFTLRDGSLPVFKVERLKDNSSAEEFVGNAKKYVGLPYDFTFLPDNEALYCSELVRESYRTPQGEYLFSETPMNFRDSEGNLPVYWIKLFEKLGMDVPEGVRGTNPQKMSTESILQEVEVSLPLTSPDTARPQ